MLQRPPRPSPSPASLAPLRLLRCIVSFLPRPCTNLRQAVASVAVAAAVTLGGCQPSQPAQPNGASAREAGAASAAPSAKSASAADAKEKTAPAVAPPAPAGRKIAVLLTNHGSRSATWRQALLELEARVRGPILGGGVVSDVRTAFMEYTEPSIATRLQELDSEGFTDVVLVPVFLQVSSHSFDDIPTIIGQKTDPGALERMKIERIAQYTPKARVHLTELPDFAKLLTANVLRRAKALSKRGAEEGLTLIAYGDATYEREWNDLLDQVGKDVTRELGMVSHSWGWCGHLVHYDPAKTTAAISGVLTKAKRAVVVPALIAHDEMFQVKIIGQGIAAVEQSAERVAYQPDAILPDPELDAWVIATATRHAAGVKP